MDSILLLEELEAGHNERIPEELLSVIIFLLEVQQYIHTPVIEYSRELIAKLVVVLDHH